MNSEARKLVQAKLDKILGPGVVDCSQWKGMADVQRTMELIEDKNPAFAAKVSEQVFSMAPTDEINDRALSILEGLLDINAASRAMAVATALGVIVCNSNGLPPDYDTIMNIAVHGFQMMGEKAREMKRAMKEAE